MKTRIATGILAAFLLAAGCKKEEPEINPVPYIEIVNVTPTTVQQFSQKVAVTFSYDDQDGDLGFDSADSLSLSVRDSRLTLADFYHVSPLAPPGETLHIKGSITVQLQAPFLLGSGSPEVIRYYVKIKDRAGNWSNEVQTPDITITP